MNLKELQSTTHPPLKDLIFRAKIDYLSLITPGELPLPVLRGKPIWSRRLANKCLSIHDASPGDIRRLSAAFGDLRLRGLEVSVDVSCASHVPVPDRASHLERVMVGMFAKGLDPLYAGRSGYFRGAWRFGGPVPFNKRLPRPTDQLIYGHRTDPWQTKAYFKKVDMGASLHAKDWVARVEVALHQDQLELHRVETIRNLQGFPFRRELMTYFQHVRGVAERQLAWTSTKGLRRLLLAKRNDFLQQEFARVGVGCIKRGGKFEAIDTKRWMNTPVNDRIGQALHRLQASMRR